jgi:hypothetical protein
MIFVGEQCHIAGELPTYAIVEQVAINVLVRDDFLLN